MLICGKSSSSIDLKAAAKGTHTFASWSERFGGGDIVAARNLRPSATDAGSIQ
jgi:hypothetical protein